MTPGDISQSERPQWDPQKPHPKPTFTPGAVLGVLWLQQLPVLFPGDRGRRGPGPWQEEKGLQGRCGGSWGQGLT